MSDNWVGKSISINCSEPGGVFQGTIKDVSPEAITIVRAFRNGVPVPKPETEVTIACANILNLELIPAPPSSNLATHAISKPTPIKHPNFPVAPIQENGSLARIPVPSTSRQAAGKASPSTTGGTSTLMNNGKFYPTKQFESRSVSKPLDIAAPMKSNNGGSGSYKNDRKKSRRQYNSKNETFGTPVDDPMMDEDFDFEKNLALFNKQAIWDEIDAMQKPDLLRQTVPTQRRKYRHDENVITSEPAQLRQIEVDYNSSRDYVTGEGLIVPSIPLIVRNRVQTAAEALGLSWERQCDVLARGTTEIALQLLGGGRRLVPNNSHQWPTIVVICEEPYNDKKSEIGICTGRQLATQGLKVVAYVREFSHLSHPSRELDLFNATDSAFTNNVKELPSGVDLIILSVRSAILTPVLLKWINESRASVLAIDPPVHGISQVQIKCSILPILPLDDINRHACGKLYLCNLGIPDKFFREAGIKYKSPFGHKFVIPIHLVE
ncbi:enhancer of mRNA-decapping protein 3 [Phlebotomus argentipes]|uniref:enhancer of mRNA-decapping protein 3 n=1 Tax=Phlebotomus argentipes TaxID=94469 RepID=UPI0028931585|nr:enhancer of mRNA-decapping protein 3 [Phlebotomus argentipes]